MISATTFLIICFSSRLNFFVWRDWKAGTCFFYSQSECKQLFPTFPGRWFHTEVITFLYTLHLKHSWEECVFSDCRLWRFIDSVVPAKSLGEISTTYRSFLIIKRWCERKGRGCWHRKCRHVDQTCPRVTRLGLLSPNKCHQKTDRHTHPRDIKGKATTLL